MVKVPVVSEAAPALLFNNNDIPISRGINPPFGSGIARRKKCRGILGSLKIKKPTY
jgi:hypothetical protein